MAKRKKGCDRAVEKPIASLGEEEREYRLALQSIRGLWKPSEFCTFPVVGDGGDKWFKVADNVLVDALDAALLQDSSVEVWRDGLLFDRGLICSHGRGLHRLPGGGFYFFRHIEGVGSSVDYHRKSFGHDNDFVFGFLYSKDFSVGDEIYFVGNGFSTFLFEVKRLYEWGLAQTKFDMAYPDREKQWEEGGCSEEGWDEIDENFKKILHGIKIPVGEVIKVRVVDTYRRKGLHIP